MAVFIYWRDASHCQMISWEKSFFFNNNEGKSLTRPDGQQNLQKFIQIDCFWNNNLKMCQVLEKKNSD